MPDQNIEPGWREEPGQPLYMRVKALIRRRVATGEWPPEHRLPSENALVDSLGISRMTVHRALRELAAEGVVVRVRGSGSFVAAPKRSSRFQEVPNIADEIDGRGRRHDAEVVRLEQIVCGPELAEALEVESDAPAFHSVIVHREEDLPIQMEDRFVVPAAAPDYLAQDFVALTPNRYLSRVAPLTRTEQFIEAVTAQPWERHLLQVSRSEPCLLVRRRTWSNHGLVSAVRLLYPGARYRLESRS